MATGQAESIPTTRIFVSSPGDVAEERSVALASIRRLQGWFQGRLVLVPILWEQEPLLANAGFQQEIDRRAPPSKADIALFVLWSRLGTPLSGAFVLEDGRRPTGTEWEFEEARKASAERELPHILVYRKAARPLLDATRKEEALAGLTQYQAVQDLFDRHFRDATDLSFKGSFHTFGDASEFGRLLETHLSTLLQERLAGSAADPVTWHGSPFRGLETFEAEHARIFFGRTRAVHEVRQALAQQVRAGRAFVVILGPSGNGKSSLARAGLLPLLTGPWVVEEGVVGGFCLQAVVRPGDGSTPLEALARALQAGSALPDLASQGSPSDLTRAYAKSPEAAVNDVRGALARASERRVKAGTSDAPPPARLVLLVDQLEELFTREGLTTADREAFAEVLSALARSGVVWVLATLRSDFYSAFSRLGPLMALKEGVGQYDLLPPDAAEVAEIVRLPARVAGLVYETDAARGRSLDDVILGEAGQGPDALPLLEYALTLLEGEKEGNRLTFRAYEAIGGLEGAIGTHAERTWKELPDGAKGSFPRLLRALVEVADGSGLRATARRTPRALVDEIPGGRAFVDVFVKARLLVADGRGAETTVSVAHEALLRRWPRAADQIGAEAELLRIQTRLRAEAARWDAAGRPRRWEFWRGRDLEGALLLPGSGFDLEERERACLAQAERQARRVRVLKRVAVGAIAALAIVAIALWVQATRAQAREAAAKERAVANAGRLADLNTLRGALLIGPPKGAPGVAEIVDGERRIKAGLAALARLPDHERELRSLEERATSRPGDGPGSWRFADPSDAATHALLSDLVKGGEDFARRFQPSAPWDDAALWAETIRAVADRRENPLYGGLRLPGPQFGLRPLGKSPQSGLFEFSHVYSGNLDEGQEEGRHPEDGGIVLVLIPDGTFMMGWNWDTSTEDFTERSTAGFPSHEVTVPAFFLSKYEVTQAQWLRMAGEKPSHFHAGVVEGTAGRNPVENVSWYDCRNALALYALRLPTEAEWEYACRARTSDAWSFGPDIAESDNYAWTRTNSEKRTHEVGTRRPNPWGLFDVHGNVSEWVEDSWHELYEGAPREGSAWAEEGSGDRVVRGGSWGDDARLARSAIRNWMPPAVRGRLLGVRPARPVIP